MHSGARMRKTILYCDSCTLQVDNVTNVYVAQYKRFPTQTEINLCDYCFNEFFPVIKTDSKLLRKLLNVFNTRKML